MESVEKTLYIPLFGKSWVSQKGIILNDPKAEKIWKEEGFPLDRNSRSKWLAYFMAMRSAVTDQWVRDQTCFKDSPVVIHLGCGLDSRNERVGLDKGRWYEVDFPDVIRLRKKYYSETPRYRMLESDILDYSWMEKIADCTDPVIVMEGVSMFLKPEQLEKLMRQIKNRFPQARILMDCYTALGAFGSRVKNPVRSVGVQKLYGVADAEKLASRTGFVLSQELSITPDYLIRELQGTERAIFKSLYGGALSGHIYRICEFTAAS